MPSKKGKILVVDDEPAILKLMLKILERAGHKVLLAGGVLEAKEVIAQNENIDLIVTDLNMPESTGLDLIRDINQNHPEIGVVVATILDNPIGAEEVLEAGVYGYIVKPFSRNLVLITIANALRRKELEAKTRASVKNLESRLHLLIDNLHIGLLLIDESMQIVELNNRVKRWFNDAEYGHSVSLLDNYYLSSEQNVHCGAMATAVLETGQAGRMLGRFSTQEGERDLNILMVSVCSIDSGESWVIIMIDDQTEHLLMERELRQAQKLEAIGQLAAGIAHEINTPTQYVGDNIRFISDAFENISKLVNDYEELTRSLAQERGAEVQKKIGELREEADIEFLEEEIPLTIAQSLEGVTRVGSIVKALREFSHPGSAEKTPTDINHCLESTVTVCRNEWKYVADMELKLDHDLPAVPCLPGEMNQVFLNLIINAAHAIAGQVEKGRYTKGVISITTEQKNNHIHISIQDNGGGIPESIRYRIFDPFFTTKEIGKGTGQGLAIARNIVSEKHGGSLTLDSCQGKGTTFSIKLPLHSGPLPVKSEASS